MKKLILLAFIAIGCDESSRIQCPCIVTAIKKNKDDYTIRVAGKQLSGLVEFFDFNTKTSHNIGDTIK